MGRQANEFVADTIDLDIGRAMPIIGKMRERFKRPEKTAEALFLDMQAIGLTHTVDSLRAHLLSL